MEVRIIKNDKPQSWYRDRVGEVFNVLDVDEENKQYIVHKGRIVNSYINFEDCEIIANDPKTSNESEKVCCDTCKYILPKQKCSHPQGCEADYELWKKQT